MPIYERGPVRIHYEEMGSGFPLLVIPGGGLNSTIAGLDTSHPFNAMKEFARDGFRCVGADLRNANPGQSSGPLEVDRPWDSYTDDHIGLMDHLGIDKFMVLGYCIGQPFIWNLIKRAAIAPSCPTSSTRTTSPTGVRPWSRAGPTSPSSR
jgi:pimeloyl-ACP methyl ester carboxylesterase